MTTRSILCTLAVLFLALLAVASLALAPADAPVAGTTTEAVLVAATSPATPAAPAPATSSPFALAAILTMIAVKPRDHEGEAVRYRLSLDAVCGVDWSGHTGFLSAKTAEAPRLKLIQLLANKAAFRNVYAALRDSLQGWHEHWSLPMKAICKLVDRLERRNSHALQAYENRIADLIGTQASVLTAESEREGYLLIDDGEEDENGWPVLTSHRWKIDLPNKEFLIY